MALSDTGTVKIGSIELQDVSQDYLFFDAERRQSVRNVIGGVTVQDFGIYYTGREVTISGNEFRPIIEGLRLILEATSIVTCEDVWENEYSAVVYALQSPSLMGSNPRALDADDVLYPYTVRMRIMEVTKILGTSV